MKSYVPWAIIVFFLYFDRHCPALSQPFTKRVLLDQHIHLMHGVKDPEGKTVNSDDKEASPDKETVPWCSDSFYLTSRVGYRTAQQI